MTAPDDAAIIVARHDHRAAARGDLRRDGAPVVDGVRFGKWREEAEGGAVVDAIAQQVHEIILRGDERGRGERLDHGIARKIHDCPDFKRPRIRNSLKTRADAAAHRLPYGTP